MSLKKPPAVATIEMWQRLARERCSPRIYRPQEGAQGKRLRGLLQGQEEALRYTRSELSHVPLKEITMSVQAFVALSLVFTFVLSAALWAVADARRSHDRVFFSLMAPVTLVGCAGLLWWSASLAVTVFALTAVVFGIARWCQSQEASVNPSWLYRQL